MLHFEDIHTDLFISGLESGQTVQVVSTKTISPDALTIYYKCTDGSVRERMLFRNDEERLTLADKEMPWSFSTPGDAFKLASEAFRIHLAHLFDPMMAVHTSDVQPLPHQITAVYESMLPRQPLRFVLADDPGSGKTIMAGLFIRELLMRADAKRILIVSPGSLTEQWQDELRSKFGLEFTLFTRELLINTPSGNPFDDHSLLIARLDQLARSKELQQKIELTSWDLVVVDEAHKLSASHFGRKINKTQRFRLGELLGARTRHFLLMTATPHNGKEDEFQLFLSLLDPERFYGKFREESVEKVDVTDIMRRMVKEELITFDGTPLFPERRAYALTYILSEFEQALYEDVTRYVREEMGKADQLDGSHKGRVGFALTSIQRRLASSPEAIWQTLRRRKHRLEKRMQDVEAGRTEPESAELHDLSENLWDAEESMPASEYEEAEEQLVDQATASRTRAELQAEICTLAHLEAQALDVRQSTRDRKWDELSHLLQTNENMRDEHGSQRKLIIFTEYRDTLNYLQNRIGDVLGTADAVEVIHGGVTGDARRRAQERFRFDKTVKVLVATDAAGEGVNLQNANLMVNYDLPWNPNRLEQRFGRIHRIGQLQVCHLWNLVAIQTREGEVFHRLFEKMETQRKALGGRVFDVLGELFDETSLKDMLIEAIRYGQDPERQAHLSRVVDAAFDPTHIKSILDRNSLCTDIMVPERLFAVKEEMERAEAKKLQPHYIRSFFIEALKTFGGIIKQREGQRYEISRVPERIVERGERLKGKQNPVLRKYERVCFERDQIQLKDRVGAPLASLLHPGHTLLQTLVDMILETGREGLKQGAILVDPTDAGQSPRLLCVLDHAIKDAHGSVVSRQFQFVELQEDGTSHNAGCAPYLDYEPLHESDSPYVHSVLQQAWLTSSPEILALTHAVTHLVPAHYTEVSRRITSQADKIRAAVRTRLVREINYQTNVCIKYRERIAAGKDQRLQLENVQRTVEDLQSRLQNREKELETMKDVRSSTPVVLGGALIVPAGLLAELKGQAVPTWCVDAAARSRIEQLAMQAVMQAEEAQGNTCHDVSTHNCGWDITSIPPACAGGGQAEERHIEVKGRAKGQSTITVTSNEICTALNQGDKFLLAVVLVDRDTVDGPHYVPNPFTHEPGWGVTSVNYDLNDLLAKARSF